MSLILGIKLMRKHALKFTMSTNATARRFQEYNVRLSGLPLPQQQNSCVDDCRKLIVRRQDGRSTSLTRFIFGRYVRKENGGHFVKIRLHIFQSQRHIGPIIVVSVKVIIRHFEIINDYDGLRKFLTDEQIFITQRQIIIPMRIEIEECDL